MATTTNRKRDIGCYKDFNASRKVFRSQKREDTI